WASLAMRFSEIIARVYRDVFTHSGPDAATEDLDVTVLVDETRQDPIDVVTVKHRTVWVMLRACASTRASSIAICSPISVTWDMTMVSPASISCGVTKRLMPSIVSNITKRTKPMKAAV
ncbi:hypothetical protein, partial [Stutzerimonas xanthomarina]|uniref:hypothetical protein n=1 Tax=Stutzerimonas xanthomarina TaxID=271420 RepID=UPI003AA84DE9